MPLKIFILEDEIHEPPRNALLSVLKGHSLTVATSRFDGEKKFNPKERYDLLLLDHDMRGYFEDSDYPNTGYQFLKWILETYKDLKLPQVILHSQNWTGRTNMRSILAHYGHLNVDECPFGPKYLKLLKGIACN